jgi:hypothetical protein
LTETERAYFYEIVDFDLANLSHSKAIIRFEASWPKGKRQASIKRTGGPAAAEPPEVPTRLLASLPITTLNGMHGRTHSTVGPYSRFRAGFLFGVPENQRSNLAVGLLGPVVNDIPVHVHRCSDIGMAH